MELVGLAHRTHDGISFLSQAVNACQQNFVSHEQPGQLPWSAISAWDANPMVSPSPMIGFLQNTPQMDRSSPRNVTLDVGPWSQRRHQTLVNPVEMVSFFW